MLPLIQSEVLEKGWMTQEEIINFIAVSESTPGPFAINIATYVGSQMGGVLGAAKTATVTNCINYGDVVGKGYYLGGILGVVITSGVMTINDCENHGSVTASANAAGGIVGGPVNESKGEMYVSGCTNTGAISAPSMAGGIVGKMTKGTIADDNVNSGVITATTEGGVSGEIIGLQK